MEPARWKEVLLGCSQPWEKSVRRTKFKAGYWQIRDVKDRPCRLAASGIPTPANIVVGPVDYNPNIVYLGCLPRWTSTRGPQGVADQRGVGANTEPVQWTDRAGGGEGDLGR
ncbi:hypothetical protein DHEL01_v208723 [Diaporthe helianthi]|uniref:Uncharacterized protein n=1 Tax=Diaporthe helianthi TaxID=158607 RepID=A0A2P5HRI9_DIAHE|nr:hypothetical protein DHEL01_v208723 [Diaporthe helianthi]